MAVHDDTVQRARFLWFSCLNAAFRTALACAIVGVTTLYGPATLRNQIAFPAFSYVTVILVVTNATLGDAIRGCWLAAYATLQGVCPAILCLWIIGPTGLTTPSTAVVLGVSAFFVALPERTHLIAKRIALGQLVIVYVIGYINGGGTEPVMHPLHVAASTGVGVGACALAMLLPFPYLASSEVKQNCTMLAENISGRLDLLVKAFCAQEEQSSQSLISQARSLAAQGTKSLHCIISKQESMHWERLPIKLLKPYFRNPGDRFEKLETLLRGIEMGLTNSSFPIIVPSNSEELKNGLKTLEANISLHLNQIRSWFHGDSMTVPESNSGPKQANTEFLQTIQTTKPPTSNQDLPAFFFLFCLNLLSKESKAFPYTTTTTKSNLPVLQSKEDSGTDPCKQNRLFYFFKGTDWILTNWTVTLTKTRLIAALKCSLSIFLAVLFGLLYSKENGYWAGLPVAISLASSREATFRVANVKAQGTVIGTVYGVLGCFVFERFVKVRFLALLPWFIVTSFIQRSKMYGQAGAVSAVIGAVLILGRKNFGPPSVFAIDRIVETFIGLLCSIMVELLLQPTRAASLAKSQLCKTLGSLHSCVVSSMDLGQVKGEMVERREKFKLEVTELGKFVEEAEMEPNFWFIPFGSCCYRKLMVSLVKMSDLLLFAANAIPFIEEHMEGLEKGCREGLDKINGQLEVFRKVMGSSIRCYEKIGLVKALSTLEKQTPSFGELEMGKVNKCMLMSDNESKMEKVMSSFLDHLQEVVNAIQSEEEEERKDGKEEMCKGEMVLSLSALGFCMSGLIKETREVERSIKELVQWENPTSQVNLNEIYCKFLACEN